MEGSVHQASFPTLISTQMVQPPNSQPQVIRRTANYHPSAWGHYFLSHDPDHEIIDAHVEEERHLELKEEVRKMLVSTNDDHSHHQLNLIDHIQRLGIAYHFEKEIDLALQHEYDTCRQNLDKHEQKKHDLYTTALRFRLLRQQGHNISCDVFDIIKDDEGNIKEGIANDVRGMLSLYEATHMRIHGEDILEEALEFTVTHLEAVKSQLNNPLAAQVANALNQPLRKTLPRIEARRYISLYQEDSSCNQFLLNFAKLDFNLSQKLHKGELRDLSRWWKDLDFANKLPFARDRMVECFFWILGVYFEPQYRFARKTLTKIIALTSVMDDIYDVYGTVEELLLFTRAIERWNDKGALDSLPQYMKEWYQSLLNVYLEAEEELAKEGTSNLIDYAKATMKGLAKAYMEEAIWFHQGFVPSIDEYLKVSVVSTGYIMLVAHSFVVMGEEECVTKDTLEWVIEIPPIIKASAIICRLMDDMVGHEIEQERGHVASAVECYMKQYCASKKQAYDVFRKQVTDAWKDINEQCLIFPTTTTATACAVPMNLLNRILNFARVIDTLYKDKDGYTNSNTNTKHLIASILVDPFQI